MQAVKAGEEQTASSRLMHMIGVTSQSMGDDADGKHSSDAGTITDEDKEPSSGEDAEGTTTSASIFSFSSSVPRNPWGDPVVVAGATPNAEATNEPANSGAGAGGGLDLAARLKEVALDKQTAAKQLSEMTNKLIVRNDI